MAKEVKSVSQGNSCGVTAVILGILSIIFASANGIILGVIALFFAAKQQKISPNKWSRSGKILAIIGIVLSIVMIIVTLYYLPELSGYLY